MFCPLFFFYFPTPCAGLFCFVFFSNKLFRYSPSGDGIRLFCGLKLTPHSGEQGSGPTHTQDFLTAKPVCDNGFPSWISSSDISRSREASHLAGCLSAQHCSTEASFSVSAHRLARGNYCLAVAVHRRKYQLQYNSKRQDGRVFVCQRL